jgi:hypothetical protein
MDNAYHYFASPVYVGKHPEFVDSVRKATASALENAPKEVNEIYPMHHTINFANDPTVEGFCSFVGNKGWEFLAYQGYEMRPFGVSIDAVWAQVHYKHSLMEQHVHPGVQLVGFYFLETPDGSSRPMFHDPRPGKVQAFLPETSPELATLASNIIHFTPEPGMLIISNAWLPHSFGRHASEEPLKFVHFNLGVRQRPEEFSPPQTTCKAPPPAEVV